MLLSYICEDRPYRKKGSTPVRWTDPWLDPGIKESEPTNPAGWKCSVADTPAVLLAEHPRFLSWYES